MGPRYEARHFVPDVVLIMSSGSGKTTLLNVLAHREASTRASVKKSLLVNGRQTSLRDFRRISSFVEQEDALLGALTVKETMYFVAKLSLPRSIIGLLRSCRTESLIKEPAQ